MIHGKKVVAIIPARFASTRFPGKPLVDLGGKPMIQRTYERVKSVDGFDRIVIATDDQRIFDAAVGFGAEVMLTSETHLTGTDRCAEVARLNPGFDVVINIQGDEPLVDFRQLDDLINAFEKEMRLITDSYTRTVEDNISKLKLPIDEHFDLLVKNHKLTVLWAEPTIVVDTIWQQSTNIALMIYTRNINPVVIALI